MQAAAPFQENDMHARIVETDKHDSDYPDERWVNLPVMSKDSAERIVKAVNAECCNWLNAARCWKVVEMGYALKPGFEL